MTFLSVFDTTNVPQNLYYWYFFSRTKINHVWVAWSLHGVHIVHFWNNSEFNPECIHISKGAKKAQGEVLNSDMFLTSHLVFWRYFDPVKSLYITHKKCGFCGDVTDTAWNKNAGPRVALELWCSNDHLSKLRVQGELCHHLSYLQTQRRSWLTCTHWYP